MKKILQNNLEKNNDRHEYLKPIILLLVGILFLIFFLLIIRIDPESIYQNLQRINLYFLPLILSVDILFIVSYAIAWFCLVKIICPNVRFKTAVLIVVVGWFGDMLIPAAFMTGEALRLILLKKIYKLDMSKAAATVVIHRLLNASAFLFYISIGMLMLIFHNELGFGLLGHSMIIVVLSIFGLSITFIILKKIYFLKVFLKKIIKIAYSFFKRKKTNIDDKIDSIFFSFEKSLNIIMKNKLKVLFSFLVLLFQWFLGVTIPYLFFLSIGYRINFWILSVAYPIYSLMDNIPIGIPANAGVLDVAMISTFVILGVPKEIATLVTILTRSVIVVFEAILTGTISVIFFSRSIYTFSVHDLKEFIKD